MVCETGTVAIDDWFLHAASIQNALARQNNICYATLEGTHNSAITLANGYGNSDAIYNEQLEEISMYLPPWSFWRTNNQWLSLTDQLRLGVRSLELDTHWFQDDLKIAHCGGVNIDKVNNLVDEINELLIKDGRAPIDWDTETLGCDPSFSNLPARDQRTFASALQEIVAWMQQDQNLLEFVVLMLDCQDDLLTWGKVPVLQQTLESIVGQSVGIFTPQDYAALGYWPRLADMVKAGKRVLVAVDADIASNTTNYFQRATICDWTEPDLYGWTFFPECFNGDVRANVGQLVRLETDAIQYGPFNSGGGWGLSESLNATQIPDFVNCNVNMPAPDLYSPEVAESTIWTWAPGEPSVNTTACVVVDATVGGRWFALPSCDDMMLSCLNDTSTEFWNFAQQSQGCPAKTTFAFPTTAYNNQLLVVAMQASGLKQTLINYPMLLNVIS